MLFTKTLRIKKNIICDEYDYKNYKKYHLGLIYWKIEKKMYYLFLCHKIEYPITIDIKHVYCLYTIVLKNANI